ncbi:MAG: 5-methyltetrahydropteroyltriglutamate--homocysteine S-methyltransferase, partial [Spirochaetaceae bacterium]
EELYKAVDCHPQGELSLYDPFMDAAFMTGILPFDGAAGYYNYCRGNNALPMKKYFNTNYHYLRPNIKSPDFSFSWDKYKYLSVKNPSVLSITGPFTLLKLSHLETPMEACAAPLARAYAGLFDAYPDALFHVEEPAFVLDLSVDDVKIAGAIYHELQEYLERMYCLTYYDSVEVPELLEIEFAAWGLDFVAGPGNLSNLKHLNKKSILIAGLVDGRNVFKKDDRLIRERLSEIKGIAGNEIWISNAGPLSHLPFSTENETDPVMQSRFVFAREKLDELRECGKINLAEIAARTPKVSKKAVSYDIPDSWREPYEKRLQAQAWLGLPVFPTTTIGSFPQSEDVRKMRNDFRKHRIDSSEYEGFINNKIKEAVRMQEELGYDVLVHGEYERTDMVEYFAEKLSGIHTTENGWIISYGSRCYRPPIIEGNVARLKPMTLEEIKYAQSLTKKPVKGMLTGPVTIIAWSFVNPDIPIQKIAHEIGNALQQEVRDYIKAGIRVIQIDEPAFREKAPVKRAAWPGYFDWAVKAFRVAAFAAPDVQIHTHMCYSDFDEIIAEIERLDADVISIEASRSRGEIIKAFETYKYSRQIGLGVWDIHSPLPPAKESMSDVVSRSIKQIPRENFWINPDCGLKTRKWKEIEAPLTMITEVARELRYKMADFPAAVRES